MAQSKFALYKYVKLEQIVLSAGKRAALYSNGKVKPNLVIGCFGE